MADFPIAESYTDSLGQFVGYDTENGPLLLTASGLISATVSGVQNAILSNQEHIDIRGFVPSGIVTLNAYDMLNLSADTMNVLDGFTMGQLSNSIEPYGDQWSAGTVGPIASLSNIVGLTWTLTSGSATTTSTLLPVDLSTGFQSTDYVCLSLPQFPVALINQVNSYVSLSDGVNTTNLYFNQSFTPLTSGNTCASWYYPQLAPVLEPTTVSLIINALAPCTIKATGLRLLSDSWSPLTLDMNTEGQFLRPITTQSGIIPTTPYPTSWRCAVPQGINDPRPINASFGALFYTGSLTQNSTINIYQRGRSEAALTQLDLDYVNPSVGYTQGDLDALGHQPDFGTSYFQPSTQAILNLEDQAQLNLQEQWQLERINDITNQYWIQSALTYQPNSGFTVGVNNYTSVSGVIYTSTASGIAPNSYYLFNTDVEDTTIRITVDPVTNIGIVTTSGRLFDSGVIPNSLFRRTAGRMGWGVQFGDGDAFVKGFVSQSLMFAEYKSKIFQTRTPVKGASLTVGATPPTQLFMGAGPYGLASVTPNFAISNSSTGSLQVNTTAGAQGILTNMFTVTNFSEFQIAFDLYIPQSSLNVTTPICMIVNSYGYVTPFAIGQILPDSWNTYTISSTAFNLLPGTYTFAIVSISDAPITFYIDNISLSQTVIAWSARSAYQDPWGAQQIPFVSFGTLLNDTSDGVLFQPMGSSLQVKALAYSQQASIGSFYLSPLYAQLGNTIL